MTSLNPAKINYICGNHKNKIARLLKATFLKANEIMNETTNKLKSLQNESFVGGLYIETKTLLKKLLKHKL
ncbi:hypothetical protein BH23BAC1_BH23BAC1_36790 [soil metagenome]